MTAEIYLFNPENDMALANFTPYYKVASEIMRMKHDLEMLPAWFAPPGSRVRVGDIPEVAEYAACLAEWGIRLPVGWTGEWEDAPYVPWGWNPALLHTLRTAGVPEQRLLTDRQMRLLRELSGRETGRKVLYRLKPLEGVCGESWVCRSSEEVCSHLNRLGQVMLKAPWSGSGRGVMKAGPSDWNASLQGWVQRIIRTQGGIMVEPLYQKSCDFAMEFYADGKGQVNFAGYSLFDTDEHGNYKGNFLLPDAEIVRSLTAWVSPHTLDTVREALLAELSALLGTAYRGYLGVDMMICRIGENWQVHPCVEINLRMNMGVVSRLFFDRWMDPLVRGRFVVEHYFADGEALEAHHRLLESCPLSIRDNRMTGGYLSLTPVARETRYQIYVQVSAPASPETAEG